MPPPPPPPASHRRRDLCHSLPRRRDARDRHPRPAALPTFRLDALADDSIAWSHACSPINRAALTPTTAASLNPSASKARHRLLRPITLHPPPSERPRGFGAHLQRPHSPSRRLAVAASLVAPLSRPYRTRIAPLSRPSLLLSLFAKSHPYPPPFPPSPLLFPLFWQR